MRRIRLVLDPRRRTGFAWTLLLLSVLLVPSASADRCTLPVQFGPAQNVVTGWNPAHFVTGDFDEDGFTDLAVATSLVDFGGPGAVTILLAVVGKDDPLVAKIRTNHPDPDIRQLIEHGAEMGHQHPG